MQLLQKHHHVLFAQHTCCCMLVTKTTIHFHTLWCVFIFQITTFNTLIRVIVSWFNFSRPCLLASWIGSKEIFLSQLVTNSFITIFYNQKYFIKNHQFFLWGCFPHQPPLGPLNLDPLDPVGRASPPPYTPP